jgi:hypothetical protein
LSTIAIISPIVWRHQRDVRVCHAISHQKRSATRSRTGIVTKDDEQSRVQSAEENEEDTEMA